MNCSFSHDDGSYVLGALAPAQRQAFEEHLSHCAECAQSVRALAGMPGLLARVDPRLLADTPEAVSVPATLLPALTHRVRRSRRRWLTALVGVTAAAVAAVVVLALTTTAGNPEAPLASPTTSVGSVEQHVMRPVGTALLRAQVAFAPADWGTRLDLTCSYAKQHVTGHDGYGSSGPTRYALVVRTRDGHEQQIATWRGAPGQTVTLNATTDSRRADIASVEIRTTDGKTVLRSTV